MKSLNLQISSLVGYVKKALCFSSLLYSVYYALVKLIMINGVYIKAFGKLKWD